MRISQPRCTHCRCNARTPGAARAVLARAEQDGPPKTQLEILVRRKQSALAAELDALGMEGLSEKLSDAMANPAQNKYRLGQVLSNFMPQRRVAIIAEVPKAEKGEPSERLAERARILSKAGVQALSVKTDAYDTDLGLQDLFTVVRAVPNIPVLRRDWIIHPLQIIEAKEAGAAGVLGIVCQVNGKGTPVLSSFASTMGLDAPAEVVNQIEVDFLLEKQVPMIAVNVGVGLSAKIPGFSAQVAEGILKGLPLHCASVVGVGDVEQARRAAAAGASAVLLKAEFLAAAADDERACRECVHDVQYAVSGDD